MKRIVKVRRSLLREMTIARSCWNRHSAPPIALCPDWATFALHCTSDDEYSLI